MRGSVLPAVLSLAIIDSINLASIAGALYLAGSGRKRRLRLFILAVSFTYLLFGLALTLGPAATLRSSLADTPIMIGPFVEVAVGVLLVGIGVRTWRRRASRRRPFAPPRFGSASALSLGVLTTLADLPTAGPLLVASALIAATNARPWTQVTDLLLYNVVYIAPLIAVALAHSRITSTTHSRTRLSRAMLAWAPAVVAGLCVTAGAVVSIRGAAALI
jgi:cytochrome c biogenesis protein CcdA